MVNFKFGHTLCQIQYILIMSRIDICHTLCSLGIQTVGPTLPVFEGIKKFIQYLATHPHKPILYPSCSYGRLNVIRITWSGYHI